jgi:hypothetical protein
VSHHARLVTGLIALFALAGALGAGSATPATSPQLTLNLNVNQFLEVITPGGTSIRTSNPPGTVIPYGTYQVVINNDVPDTLDVAHMYHLGGPGVNLQTDLDAGDHKTELYAETLAPNSTYIFQDDRQPGLGRVVFSTSGTVVSGSATGTTGASSGTGTTSNNSTGSGSSSSNKGVVGSSVTPAVLRGTLQGLVTAAGIKLTSKGKAVTSLKAGRYKLAVTDTSSRGGFTLQEIRKSATTVTGGPFVGKHSVTVTLRPGQWFYYLSFTAKKNYFIVVS